MPHITSFTLSPDTASLLADSPWVSGEAAQALLDAASSLFAEKLDSELLKFASPSLITRLSLGVANGLQTAEMVSPSSGDDTLDKRPDRFGLPAGIVTQASRIALERAVLLRTTATREPSEIDIGALVHQAVGYMQVETFRDLASLPPKEGLPSLGKVSAEKLGSVLSIRYEEDGFRFYDYRAAMDRRVLDNDEKDLALLASLSDGIPAELDEISKAMIADLGFSLDDLFLVLILGMRISIDRGYAALGFRVEDFKSQALSTLPDRALNAFSFLTFSSDHLELRDLRPAGTRHQKRRVFTHPFIVDSGLVFLVRDLQFEALRRWWFYVLNGDWPTPVGARKKLTPQVAASIERRRNLRGTGVFEPFVERELTDIGLPWASTSGSNVNIGSTTITGEVDGIVVDLDRDLIWVLEFKDETSDQNLRSLQNEIEKVVTKHGKQIERTASEVRKDPVGVAKHVLRSWSQREKFDNSASRRLLEDASKVREWEVRSALVVRDRSAGEFLSGFPWKVTTVSGLAETLRMQNG